MYAAQAGYTRITNYTMLSLPFHYYISYLVR